MAPALHSINPDTLPVCRLPVPPFPPWSISRPFVLFDLHADSDKGSTYSDVFISRFKEILSRYADRSAFYTDGSKAGDVVAWAAVGSFMVAQRRLPNGASIYTAELQGILLALSLTVKSRATDFIIFSDSLSALEAISKCKFDHPLVIDILVKLNRLAGRRNSAIFCWVPSHVGIEGNERVDRAAVEALQHDAYPMPLPWSDFKPRIAAYIRKSWQETWDTKGENKLHSIKQTLGPPTKQKLPRHSEVVLCRARIGHTHLTHAFLLKGEGQPQCGPCLCLLSVEHILLHCPVYANSRAQHFSASSMSELFSHVKASIN